MGYYNWNDTLARDALVTMVIGYRGVGKTYGLRMQFVRDYLKDGSRFCDISRTKSERHKVSQDYFSKIEHNGEFDNYIFKYTGNKCYIAKKPEEGEKPDWELMGYFVALTEAITAKKETFVGVKRIVFDEALIDKQISPYSRYLPNEFSILANLVDSITRENVNNETKAPHLYLLGNAVDMVNPYFMGYGIDKVPENGFTWYDGKKFLLHYPKGDGESIKKKVDTTLSGYLASKTEQGKSALYNEFSVADDGLIAKKTRDARFAWGWRYKGHVYGVWQSKDSYIYINRQVPKSGNPLIYALTKDDESVNLVMAKRNEDKFLFLKECYYAGLLRYDTNATRLQFLDMMRIYGIV